MCVCMYVCERTIYLKEIFIYDNLFKKIPSICVVKNSLNYHFCFIFISKRRNRYCLQCIHILSVHNLITPIV